MAEMNVNVTPGSGGPNIDLEQVDNGNSRQVIVIGDPVNSIDVAPVDSVNGLAVDNKTLPPLAATSTHQTDGLQKTQVVGSTGNVTNVSSSGGLSVDITGIGSSALGQEVSSASIPVVIASDQSAITVNDVPPILTKGTQGSTGFSVQSLIDAGRTPINFSIDRIAGVAAEALATFTINRGGSISSSTQYTVTAGKTFRIQNIFVSILDSTTTTVNGRVRIRSASTVSAASPIFAMIDLGNFTGTAAAGVGFSIQMPIPDGLEISSAQQIGISQILSSTSSTLTVSVIGYEY